uniref:Uncharacterized protein n=1 Tax=Arundo donax TaxID=35708 RepID=A0A0A9E780_ARUDO
MTVCQSTRTGWKKNINGTKFFKILDRTDSYPLCSVASSRLVNHLMPQLRINQLIFPLIQWLSCISG